MYKEMLEEEMKNSEQFTKENFGLQIGDGYPELVKEVAKSDKLGMRLILGMLMASFAQKELRESLGACKQGEKMNMAPVILGNLPAFDAPLSLLYWGIQIGRRIERESASVIKELDKNA